MARQRRTAAPWQPARVPWRRPESSSPWVGARSSRSLTAVLSGNVVDERANTAALNSALGHRSTPAVHRRPSLPRAPAITPPVASWRSLGRVGSVPGLSRDRSRAPPRRSVVTPEAADRLTAGRTRAPREGAVPDTDRLMHSYEFASVAPNVGATLPSAPRRTTAVAGPVDPRS